jgi:hypothetical protein
MKKVWFVLVLLLVSVVPVIAEDTHQESMPLQAMHNLSSAIPMTDLQLDSVAGDGFFFSFTWHYAPKQRFMFYTHCGSFGSFNCSHVEDLSHRQNEGPQHQVEVSHPQNKGSQHQTEVSHPQNKGPRPQVEVSVSCPGKDCGKHLGVDVVVDTHGGIHIEQVTQGGGNSHNTAIVRQNSGHQTATVMQMNRAAP